MSIPYKIYYTTIKPHIPSIKALYIALLGPLLIWRRQQHCLRMATAQILTSLKNLDLQLNLKHPESVHVHVIPIFTAQYQTTLRLSHFRDSGKIHKCHQVYSNIHTWWSSLCMVAIREKLRPFVRIPITLRNSIISSYNSETMIWTTAGHDGLQALRRDEMNGPVHRLHTFNCTHGWSQKPPCDSLLWSGSEFQAEQIPAHRYSSGKGRWLINIPGH